MTNDETPMTSALFDMDAVRMDSPRLVALREHDVQTHQAPGSGPHEWLAIPMKAARAEVELYGELTEAEAGSVAGIMSAGCRVLEEAGLLFYAKTERDAQDDALAWCWAEEMRVARAKGAKGSEEKQVRISDGMNAKDQRPLAGKETNE
jgi:hypothetical protein